MFLLSCPWTWQLTRSLPVDAEFLCYKYAELSDAIKGAPVISPLVFATLLFWSELFFFVLDLLLEGEAESLSH